MRLTGATCASTHICFYSGIKKPTNSGWQRAGRAGPRGLRWPEHKRERFTASLVTTKLLSPRYDLDMPSMCWCGFTGEGGMMSNLSLPVLLHEILARGDIISPEKEPSFLDFGENTAGRPLLLQIYKHGRGSDESGWM